MPEISFEHLSATTGIPLPSMLQRLIQDGKTRYGESRAEWQENWRDRLLTTPPALSCAYDFEWIDAQDAQESIDHWLNPTVQMGLTFLPFAQSGAGDCYCLIKTPELAGVGRVDHDGSEFFISHESFEDFVFYQLLESLADFSHLINEDFTEEEAHRCVVADVQSLRLYFSDDRASKLELFSRRPLNYSEVRRPCQKKVERVPHLIGQHELSTEFAVFSKPRGPSFFLKARWEVATPLASTHRPVPTWQELALEPLNRQRAIQIYKGENNVGSAEALRAIKVFLQSDLGND
jgi:hypothetical protein